MHKRHITATVRLAGATGGRRVHDFDRHLDEARLTARLARLVDAPPPLDDAERFAAHLAAEFPAVFLFLWDPSLNATHWRAEQAIRPAVVIPMVCGGNRTRHGADTQQVLASVVRTARQRNLDLPPLIAAMLRAAEPVVPELLGLPPPPA